jgi:hypothetical protein
MKCRHRLKFASLLAACALFALPVAAQVMFERSDIRIDPAPTPPPKEGEAPPPARLSLVYNIEVRSEDALQLEYIHTLNTLTDTTGVAITFAQPSIAALPRMQVFTPVDALLVAGDGTISQIYPDLVLAEMQQDIYAKDPIRAMLFLKAGEVALRGIKPRDVIAGGMFTPAPPVME